jgi:hypothetical protein
VQLCCPILGLRGGLAHFPCGFVLEKGSTEFGILLLPLTADGYYKVVAELKMLIERFSDELLFSGDVGRLNWIFERRLKLD